MLLEMNANLTSCPASAAEPAMFVGTANIEVVSKQNMTKTLTALKIICLLAWADLCEKNRG